MSLLPYVYFDINYNYLLYFNCASGQNHSVNKKLKLCSNELYTCNGMLCVVTVTVLVCVIFYEALGLLCGQHIVYVLPFVINEPTGFHL